MFIFSFLYFFLQGNIDEKRVTDLTLEEFLSYGPQKEIGKVIFNPSFFLTFPGSGKGCQTLSDLN